MKTLRWVVVVGLLGLGATVGSAEPAGSGLAGLSDKLSVTGRIGIYVPTTTVQIAPAAEASEAPHELRPPVLNGDGPLDHQKPTNDLVEEELLPTDSAVRACRVEIARRRQILPGRVPAKEVVVRFSIDRDGHVRDAEALMAPDTDLEVAACAKRVISEWTFAKRPRSAVNVERTYRFQ